MKYLIFFKTIRKYVSASKIDFRSLIFVLKSQNYYLKKKSERKENDFYGHYV